MSKLMTSVATLHAVQDGLVGLDDDVAQILPELKDREVMASYDPTTKLAVFERLKGKITLRYMRAFPSFFPTMSNTLTHTQTPFIPFRRLRLPNPLLRTRALGR